MALGAHGRDTLGVNRSLGLFLGVALLAVSSLTAAEDAGDPFGELPLVDEVRCGDHADPHPFAEQPDGASVIQTLLGRASRVLPPTGQSCFFAYRIGAGKGLQPGATYVLTLDYPEDRPRSVFVENRGCETNLGFATGAAVGDVVHGRYVHLNPESVQYPLSGQYETWRTLFTLHDRFPDLQQPRGEGPRPLLPADGFWVIISQPQGSKVLGSAGAAVSRLRLYAVPDPDRLALKLNPPSDDLPRRHLFWREEMYDGVVQSRDPAHRGVTDEIAWFEHRARLMRFLGVNTFCQDLLEFGHNQGWDSEPYGGSNWVNQTPHPQRWEQILSMLRDRGFDFDVLPYYEYAGSIGQQSLGIQRRCRPLGKTGSYTHVSWSEIANADITDPETLDDLKKVLELTILRHRDKARFLGAWLRTRPSAMPMSFGDGALLRFAVEANDRRVATREDLRADGALRQRYYEWWFGKRRDFLVAVRDYLRANGLPEAVVLFTAEASEGGPPLPGRQFVTDDPQTWQEALAAHDETRGFTVAPFDQVVSENAHLRMVLAPPFTWGEWEWQHSVPQADPQRYRDSEGVLLTYPCNRLYTVGSPEAFEAFRTRGGLAIVHHYGLNEGEMDEKTGYFVADVERAGPYCLLAEARAVAYGDPRYIGFLASNALNRGFPQYFRAFAANFLALPALPSRVLTGAASDPEVVVREMAAGGRGTYLAVVNTGMVTKAGVAVTLPQAGRATAAATGETLAARDRRLVLDLYPGQLLAIRITPEP